MWFNDKINMHVIKFIISDKNKDLIMKSFDKEENETR